MKWPSPQDYREAIQNPSSSLFDEELRSATVHLDAHDLPFVQSGQYAAVFKLQGADKSWAVRCFLQNFADRDERYKKISNFICNDALEYTVGFEMIDKGILVGSDWFPILKMDYVEGSPLGRYIRSNAEHAEKLRALLNAFEQMMLALRNDGIAHGDLQHENILVTAEGNLRLIDYDGMYVPALYGLHSNELGHRKFQHPQRRSEHFGSYLDNFSAHLIKGALETLIEDPALWRKLDKSDESLLITRDDLLDIDNSGLLHALEESEGAGKRFSQRIRTLMQAPPERLSELPFINDNVEISCTLKPLQKRLVQDNSGNDSKNFAAPGIDPLTSLAPVKFYPPSFFESMENTDGSINEIRNVLKLRLKQRMMSGAEEELWSRELEQWSPPTEPNRNNRADLLVLSLVIICLMISASMTLREPSLCLTFYLFALFIPIAYVLILNRKKVKPEEVSLLPKPLSYQMTDQFIRILSQRIIAIPPDKPVQWDVMITEIPMSDIRCVDFFRTRGYDQAVFKTKPHITKENEEKPSEFTLNDLSETDKEILITYFTKKGLVGKRGYW